MQHKLRRTNASLMAGAAALILAQSQPAQAAPVTIEFGGFVTDVADGLNILNGLTANGTSTRFTGGLTWDTATANTSGSPNGGFFQDTVTNFWVKFDNGLFFSQGGPQSYNNVQLGDDRTDFKAPAFDGIYAYAQWDTAPYGGGYGEIGISLHSLDLSALTGNGLPLALDIGKFLDPDGVAGYQTDPDFWYGFIDKQGAGMEFHLAQGNVSTDLYAAIDSGHTVPEPATAGLAIAGLATLGGLRRRGRGRTGIPAVGGQQAGEPDRQTSDRRLCRILFPAGISLPPQCAIIHISERLMS